VQRFARCPWGASPIAPDRIPVASFGAQPVWFQEKVEAGDAAVQELTEGNLRLVISVAKKYGSVANFAQEVMKGQ
jgi:hypothetical protein